MKVNQKETELLISVTELFMRLGVKSQTMDDIARHLCISKKTLYLYVKDKNELVCNGTGVMIVVEQQTISEVVKKSKTAVDELIEITKCMSSKLGEIHPSVIFDLQKYHPDAWEVIEKHKKEFVHGVMLVNLKRGIKEGFYRKNLNPEVIAGIYVMMIDSIMNPENPMVKKMTIEHLLLEAVGYHLNGISNEKGLAYFKKVLKKEQGNKLSVD